MSQTQFPPRGTKCTDCGCCDANVFAGNVPICWACDEGIHKPKSTDRTLLVKNSPEREESQRREGNPGVTPPIAQAVPALNAAPIQKEEVMPKGFRPGAVPCAIEGCENNAYPPKKYCTSKHFYNNTHPPKIGGGTRVAKPAPAPVKVPATPAVVARTIVKQLPEVVPAACTVAITGSITPAGADKFWSILSLEQKAQIIQASLRSILTAEEA